MKKVILILSLLILYFSVALSQVRDIELKNGTKILDARIVKINNNDGTITYDSGKYVATSTIIFGKKISLNELCHTIHFNKLLRPTEFAGIVIDSMESATEFAGIVIDSLELAYDKINEIDKINFKNKINKLLRDTVSFTGVKTLYIETIHPNWQFFPISVLSALYCYDCFHSADIINTTSITSSEISSRKTLLYIEGTVALITCVTSALVSFETEYWVILSNGTSVQLQIKF